MNKKRQADEILTGSKIMPTFDNVGTWTFITPAKTEGNNNSWMVNVPSKPVPIVNDS